MSIPIAIVFGLMLLTIVAHLTGGLRDSLRLNPARLADNGRKEEELVQLSRNWVQMMCAFQLVSVDLVVVTTILYFLAFSPDLIQRYIIALCVSAVFFALGIVWLLQLAALKRAPKDYLLLSHWSFWFLCSALVFWGAKDI